MTVRHHALTHRTRAAMWRACLHNQNLCGEVAEWLKAADCKSARASVRWFESSPLHHHKIGGFLLFPRDFGLGMDANRAFPMRFPSSLSFSPFSTHSPRLRATRPIHDETRIR